MFANTSLIAFAASRTAADIGCAFIVLIQPPIAAAVHETHAEKGFALASRLSRYRPIHRFAASLVYNSATANSN